MDAIGREILVRFGRRRVTKKASGAIIRLTDPIGHNCVLVDGKAATSPCHWRQRRRKSQESRHRVAKIRSTRAGKAMSNSTSRLAFTIRRLGQRRRYDIATQTRRVLFIKPNLFIVADTLESKRWCKAHSYQARWNLIANTTARSTPTLWPLATNDKDQAESGHVVPLLRERFGSAESKSGRKHRKLLGWNIFKDKVTRTVVPATTVTHTTQRRGHAAVCDAVFAAEKRRQSNPIQSVKANRAQTSAASDFYKTAPNGKSSTDADPQQRPTRISGNFARWQSRPPRYN